MQVPTLSSHVLRKGWPGPAIQGMRPFSAPPPPSEPQLEGVGDGWGEGARRGSGHRWGCEVGVGVWEAWPHSLTPRRVRERGPVSWQSRQAVDLTWKRIEKSLAAASSETASLKLSPGRGGCFL